MPTSLSYSKGHNPLYQENILELTDHNIYWQHYNITVHKSGNKKDVKDFGTISNPYFTMNDKKKYI